jgi:hypothetical protein
MKGLFVGLFLLLSWGMAQTDFSGVYVTQGRAGDVVLTLERTDDGQLTGTIAGNGVSYNLSGYTDDTGATGALETDDYTIFTVTLGTSPNELIFTLTDEKGEQPFIFTGRGDAPAMTEEVAVTPDAAQDAWIGLFSNEEATRGFKVDAVSNGEYTR